MKKNKIDNEVLKEQYEDSLFALLMDKFAVTEGQRLIDENDSLKNDAEFKLPKGIEARCEKTISDVFAAKKRKEARKKAKKILSRAAVAVLACGIVFATLFSTVSAFREAVNNLVSEDKGANTRLTVQESNVQIGNKNIVIPDGAFLPKWLPNGYVLTSYTTDSEFTIAQFSNDENKIIEYFEYVNEEAFGVDTENADITESVNINGFDGMAVIKKDTVSITWSDSKREKFVRVKSKYINKVTAIKIAESVSN